MSIEKHKLEAKEKGLTLVKKSEKPKHFIYKFDVCGHEKETRPTEIKRYKPVCNMCINETFKNEAKEKGLTLIKKSEKRGAYLYRFNACGHEKECKPFVIRNTANICQKCNETYYMKESFLYLIKIYNEHESFLKIGIAHNIKDRIRKYKLIKGYKTEVLKSVIYDNRYESTYFEKNIHRNFKIFKESPDKMRTIMQSGFTECYPLSLFNLLNDQIDCYTKKLIV